LQKREEGARAPAGLVCFIQGTDRPGIEGGGAAELRKNPSMTSEVEHRRLLAAVRPAEKDALGALIRSEGLRGWELFGTETFAEARRQLERATYDVLVLDESLLKSEGSEAWDWLASQNQTAVVLLGEGDADTSAAAYAHGVALCISRGALSNAAVAATALRRVADLRSLVRDQSRMVREIEESRWQIDALVSRLWQTFPGDPQLRWCTQRHTMERLEEEITRAVRHHCPLAIALGELESPGGGESLSTWVAEQIGPLRRRYDVAGHYGLRGFLLLLPHTSREGGVACCQRLRAALERQAPPGCSGPVRACFGVAACSGERTTVPALLRQAEQHLALALGEGGERVVGGTDSA
jgi:PleD family two-component response regulator